MPAVLLASHCSIKHAHHHYRTHTLLRNSQPVHQRIRFLVERGTLTRIPSSVRTLRPRPRRTRRNHLCQQPLNFTTSYMGMFKSGLECGIVPQPQPTPQLAPSVCPGKRAVSANVSASSAIWRQKRAEYATFEPLFKQKSCSAGVQQHPPKQPPS